MDPSSTTNESNDMESVINSVSNNSSKVRDLEADVITLERQRTGHTAAERLDR